MQKLDRLLLHFGRRTEHPGKAGNLDYDWDWSLAYAVNRDEFEYYLNALQEQGLTQKGAARLSIEGWRRYELLQSYRPGTVQVFVAMSFDSSLKAAYTDAIKPTLEAMGYQPIRMDEIEHTDDIDDRMIAEIRRSKFMVADFTLHNPGVYFEAGFAMGLGHIVVRTCREDELCHSHFDQRQYSHVLWTEPSDLSAKLRYRIEAVVP